MNLVSKREKNKRINFYKTKFFSLLYEGMTLSNQSSFWHSSLNLHLGYLKKWDVDFDYEWYLRILSKFLVVVIISINLWDLLEFIKIKKRIKKIKNKKIE